MFLTALAFVILYGGAVAVGYLTLRGEQLRDKGWFHLAALGWYFFGAVFWNFFVERSPYALIAIGGPGVIYGPCFAYFGTVWVMRTRTWAVGDHKLRLEPTFDQAEAAEKRRDMPAALRLYQAAAQGNPGHAETRRRLGEAYLKAGDVDSGIAEMRTAVGLVEDPEKKMSLAFRVADLLVELKQDRFNADLILREIERDYAGSRIGDLAKARRSRLGAQQRPAGEAPSAT